MAVISGLGVNLPPDGTPAERDLRRVAIERALADARIEPGAVDGYIAAGGTTDDLRYLGLTPRFSCAVNASGASAGYAIMLAKGVIAARQAKHVLITFASAPKLAKARVGTFSYGYGTLYGLYGPPALYAFHANRHMHLYGTTVSHLGAVAVTAREYALQRPEAAGFGVPMTLDDHRNSRMIAEPLRLLDCTRDTTDVSVAILVSDENCVARGTGVRVAGIGFGHHIRCWSDGSVFENSGEIAAATSAALEQAGVKITAIDVAQLYDAFTISVIMQLEACGFCPVGSGGPFVAAGETRLNGSIPVNTGGGSLSGFYAQGFTPLTEALRQLRREGGATQVAGARHALVNMLGGNGGVQNTWACVTLILEATQ